MPHIPAPRLQFYKSQLQTFLSATSPPFRILHSIPAALPPSSQPQTLYILDSSFNPPTLAHLHLCLSALHSHPSTARTPPRLLLLLSTLNADKGTGSASTPLPQRLVGIERFAQDILSAFTNTHPHTKRGPNSSIRSESESESPSNPQTTTSSTHQSSIGIDIGLIKYPYFHDKAQAISASGKYGEGTVQVHLTGFDTLVRVLNSKYYETKDLRSLVPFLGAHRLRVAYRPEGEGGREEQDRWVTDMAGKVEGMGGSREWFVGGGAAGIEMVEVEEGVGISSSRVREVIKAGQGGLENLVSEGVKKWIEEEKLYREE